MKKVFKDLPVCIYIILMLSAYMIYQFQIIQVTLYQFIYVEFPLFGGLFVRAYSVFNDNKLSKANEEIEQYKQLKVNRILIDRDDTKIYGEIINSASKNIWIMGHTAKRLLNDFADIESPRGEKKVIPSALQKGVNIRILITDKEYLNDSKKNDFDAVNEKLKKLANNEIYSGKLEYKYFSHIPAHSIFVFDNECFIGPIFEEVESQHTPVIHMEIDSLYAQKYLEHFEYEWKKARADQN